MFTGTVAGVALQMQIRSFGDNQFAISGTIERADLTGTANPIPVGLIVGNNSGETLATARM
jgi:hypothetical protein